MTPKQANFAGIAAGVVASAIIFFMWHTFPYTGVLLIVLLVVGSIIGALIKFLTGVGDITAARLRRILTGVGIVVVTLPALGIALSELGALMKRHYVVITDMSDSRSQRDFMPPALESDVNSVRVPPPEPSLVDHIRALERRLDKVETRLEGLRQAIDPDNPGEVLTIARLGDKARMLNERLEARTTTINERISTLNDRLSWFMSVLGLFVATLPVLPLLREWARKGLVTAVSKKAV